MPRKKTAYELFPVIFIILLVICSLVLTTIESTDILSSNQLHSVYMIQIGILFIFFMEFLYGCLRAFSANPQPSWIKGLLTHLIRPLIIVDFIVIIPFLHFSYLLITGAPIFEGHPADFVAFRILKIASLLNILKLYRKSRIVPVLQKVHNEVKNELLITFLLSIQIIIISTVLIYHFENGINDKITNMFDGLWWSVITLTTVGYGDTIPFTVGGKILGMFIGFFGIGLVALPTGILSAAFFRAYRDRSVGQEDDGRVIALD